MTHPPNVCAHCENARDPVSSMNGYQFAFEVVESIPVELCLHLACADGWCREFNFFAIVNQPLVSAQSTAGAKN